jgi:hypothetical protein
MGISLLRILLPGKNLHGDKIAGNGAYSQAYITDFKKKKYIVKSIRMEKSSQIL